MSAGSGSICQSDIMHFVANRRKKFAHERYVLQIVSHRSLRVDFQKGSGDIPDEKCRKTMIQNERSNFENEMIYRASTVTEFASQLQCHRFACPDAYTALLTIIERVNEQSTR